MAFTVGVVALNFTTVTSVERVQKIYQSVRVSHPQESILLIAPVCIVEKEATLKFQLF